MRPWTPKCYSTYSRVSERPLKPLQPTIPTKGALGALVLGCTGGITDAQLRGLTQALEDDEGHRGADRQASHGLSHGVVSQMNPRPCGCQRNRRQKERPRPPE